MARTEEDKLTQAPIKVRLGAKEYEIKPLRILKQREWRKKAQEDLGPVVERLQVSTVNNRTVVTGLREAITHFPEKMCDLVFAYAPDLPKEQILEEATEEQIGEAFGKIWELAYADFLGHLGSAAQVVKPIPSPSASALN